MAQYLVLFYVWLNLLNSFNNLPAMYDVSLFSSYFLTFLFLSFFFSFFFFTILLSYNFQGTDI